MSDPHSHHHPPELTEHEPLGISIKIVGLICTVFVIVLVVIVLLTQAGVNLAYQMETEKRWLNPNLELQEQNEEQLRSITTYRQIDAETQQYAIPIDSAMQLYIEQNQ